MNAVFCNGENVRHKFSREQQIAGLRKALRNGKTPKQFKAAMRKRLRGLTK